MRIKYCVPLILFVFVMTTLMPASYAQVLVPMPGVSQRVGASPAFDPALMAGVKVDPKHPLNMEFFISKGQEKLSADIQKDEYSKLLKYFLSALTVPQGNLWVNLSPVEKDRIIPDDLAKTRMGMDLLSQDYFLKQLTASLLYPEGKTGKDFWAKVYAKAAAYGASEIPVDAFNKVWIMPEKLIVYEDHGTAWVTYSHLKVMLESDYVGAIHESPRGEVREPPLHPGQRESMNVGAVQEPPGQHGSVNVGVDPHESMAVGAVSPSGTLHEPPLRKDIAKQTLREIIIPILEKEVNEGQNFAVLRQIVHAMALAEWYKRSLKETLLGKGYADRSKMAGIDSEATAKKWEIYDKYVQAFKAGVFNYIKEEVDPVTQETIPRKYVSGGFGANLDAAEMVITDMAALTPADRGLVEQSLALRQAFQLDRVVSRFDSPDGKAIDRAQDSEADEQVVQAQKAELAWRELRQPILEKLVVIEDELAALGEPQAPAAALVAQGKEALLARQEALNKLISIIDELGKPDAGTVLTEARRQALEVQKTLLEQVVGIQEQIAQSEVVEPVQAQGTGRLGYLPQHQIHELDVMPDPFVEKINSITRLPDGRLLAGCEDGAARVWQKILGSWETYVVLSAHAGPVRSAVMLADGRILTASADGKAFVWARILQGRSYVMASLIGHDGPVNSAVMSSDGRILTAGEDKTVKIWGESSPTSNDWKVNVTLAGHDGPVMSAVPMPDGRILTASRDGTARIWKKRSSYIEEWGLVAILDHRSGGIIPTVFSAVPMPDGRIVTASADNIIRIWKEIAPGSNQWSVDASLAGHNNAVRSAVPLDDGHLLSTSDDGTAKIWEEVSPGNWAVLVVPHAVHAEMQPDGRLVTADDKHTVRIWRVAHVVPGSPAVSVPPGKNMVAVNRQQLTAQQQALLLRLAELEKVYQAPASFDRGRKDSAQASGQDLLAVMESLQRHLEQLVAVEAEIQAADVAAVPSTPAPELLQKQVDLEVLTDVEDRLKEALLAEGLEPEAQRALLAERGALIQKLGLQEEPLVLGAAAGVVPGGAGVNFKHGRPITKMAVSSRGVVAVGDDRSNVFTLYKPGSAVPHTVTAAEVGALESLVFSKSGRYLALRSFPENGNINRKILVWDTFNDNKAAYALGLYEGDMEFSFDESALVLRTSSQVQALLWGSPSQKVTIGNGTLISSATLSPDGKFLAIANEAGWLEVVDGRSSALVKSRSRPHVGKKIVKGAFSPDGQWFVTVGGDNRKIIWHTSNWQQEPGMPPLNGAPIEDVVFSPDSRTFVTVQEDGALTLWNSQNGAIVSMSEILVAQKIFRYSPDGKHIAYFDQRGILMLRPVLGFATHALLSYVGSTIVDFGFSVDGKFLMTAHTDGTVASSLIVDSAQAAGVQLLPQDQVKPPMVLNRHRQKIRRILVTPDGRKILTRAQDGTLVVWERAKGESQYLPVQTLVVTDSTDDQGTDLAITPDGKLALTGGEGNTLNLWNLKTGRRLLRPRKAHHSGAIGGVHVSPDGKQALTMSVDRSVKLWNIKTGASVSSWGGLSGGNLGAVSPDGSRAVFGSAQGELWIWNLRKGEHLDHPETHDKQINDVLITPDSKTAMSAGSDGKIMIWNLQTGQWKDTLVGGWGEVKRLAITPDGKCLVSLNSSGTVNVWVLKSLAWELTFSGHKAGVRDIAFMPGGRLAVTGSADGTILVWDIQTGEVKLTLKGYDPGPIGETVPHSLAVTPDGTGIVAVSKGNTARFWEVGVKTVGPAAESQEIRKMKAELAWREERHGWLENLVKVEAQLEALKGNEEARAELLARQEALNKMVAVIDALEKPGAGPALTRPQRRALNEQKTTLEQVVGVQEKIAQSEAVAPVQAQGTGRLEYLPQDQIKELDAMTDPFGKKVNSVTMRSNGSILTGGEDGIAKVWHKISGAWKINTLYPGRSPLRSVVELANGCILTANEDGQAVIWGKYSNGRPYIVATLRGHTGPVNSAVMLADGRILTAGDDATARVWKETSPGSNNWKSDAKDILKWHDAPVMSAVPMPDGRMLTASQDGTARIWQEKLFSPAGWVVVAILDHRKGGIIPSVLSAVPMPNGRILTASAANVAQIWKETSPGSNEWKVDAQLTRDTGSERSAVPLAEGRILTMSDNGTAKIWQETSPGDWETVLMVPDVEHAEMQPDGRLVTVDDKGTIRIWRVANVVSGSPAASAHPQKNIVAVNRQKLTVQQQALLKKLAVLEKEYKPQIQWDAAKKRSDAAQASSGTGSAFLPSGQFRKVDTVENVLKVSANGTLRVIRVSGDNIMFQEMQADGTFKDIYGFLSSWRSWAISPDGRRFALTRSLRHIDIYVKGDDGLWAVEKNLELPGLEGINDILFSPDGLKVAVAERNEDKEAISVVEIFGFNAGAREWVSEGFVSQAAGTRALYMSFSRNSKRFLMGSDSFVSTVSDWQKNGAWKRSASIEIDLFGRYNGGTLSPDGKSFLIALADGIAVIEETAPGKWGMGNILPVKDKVKGFRLSPDGKTMVVFLEHSVSWAEEKDGEWRVIKGADIDLGTGEPTSAVFLSGGRDVAVLYETKTGTKDEVRTDMQVWRVFKGGQEVSSDRKAIEAEIAWREERHGWLEKLVKVEEELEALKGNEEARAALLARQEALNKMVAVIDALEKPGAGPALTRPQRRALEEQKTTLEQVVGVQEKVAQSEAVVQAQGTGRLEYLPQDQIREVTTLAGHLGEVNSAVMLVDGRILTASDDTTAKIWQETSKGEWAVAATLSGHANWVNSAVMLADGRILTASMDKTAKIWQKTSKGKWAVVATLSGHDNGVKSAVMLADGRILTTSVDKTAKIWQETSPGQWAVAATLSGHAGVMFSAVMLADGRILTASRDKTAKIWQETSKGEWAVAATLFGHDGYVISAVMLADGRILTASADKTAKIWQETSKGEWAVAATLSGHADWVRSAVMLADGRILTASRDKTAKIWQKRLTGVWFPVITLSGHTGTVYSAQMLSDGRILTASGDKTAKIWQVVKPVSASAVVGTPPGKNIVAVSRQKLGSEQRLLLEKLTKLEEVYKPQIQWDAAKKRSDAAQGQGLADKLESSVSGAVAPGGIDLNVKNFNFEMRASGPRLSEEINKAGVADPAAITGLVPVILSITPAQWPQWN